MLSKTDAAILRILTEAQASGQSLRVEEVAKALHVTPGLVSQRLGRMEREGLVGRTQRPVPEGREVHYLPLPWTSIRWSSPREGVFLEWTSLGELDWQFPLISQIPDLLARDTVRSFLGRLREDGLLDARKGFKPSWSKLREADYHGLTIVHFGSTARGKARPGADVDLLAFHSEDRKERLKRVQDHAADASLEGRRPIQLAVIDWRKQAGFIPSWIRDSLQADGIVIYDGLRGVDGALIGVWRLVARGASP